MINTKLLGSELEHSKIVSLSIISNDLCKALQWECLHFSHRIQVE